MPVAASAATITRMTREVAAAAPSVAAISRARVVIDTPDWRRSRASGSTSVDACGRRGGTADTPRSPAPSPSPLRPGRRPRSRRASSDRLQQRQGDEGGEAVVALGRHHRQHVEGQRHRLDPAGAEPLALATSVIAGPCMPSLSATRRLTLSRSRPCGQRRPPSPATGSPVRRRQPDSGPARPRPSGQQIDLRGDGARGRHHEGDLGPGAHALEPGGVEAVAAGRRRARSRASADRGPCARASVPITPCSRPHSATAAPASPPAHRRHSVTPTRATGRASARRNELRRAARRCSAPCIRARPGCTVSPSARRRRRSGTSLRSHQRQVVADDDQRRAAVRRARRAAGPSPRGVVRIERGGRLVGQHERRPVGERARDRDALALADRELRRQRRREVAARPGSRRMSSARAGTGEAQQALRQQRRSRRSTGSAAARRSAARRRCARHAAPCRRRPRGAATAPPRRSPSRSRRRKRRGAGRRSSASRSISVLLPQPEGPTIATTSPRPSVSRSTAIGTASAPAPRTRSHVLEIDDRRRHSGAPSLRLRAGRRSAPGTPVAVAPLPG